MYQLTLCHDCLQCKVDNGIPIQAWGAQLHASPNFMDADYKKYKDDSDHQLLSLLPFLEKIKDVDDVRVPIYEEFRIRDYIKEDINV